MNLHTKLAIIRPNMRMRFTLPKLQTSLQSSSQGKSERSIPSRCIFVQRQMSQMSIDNERLTLDTCFELQEYNDEDEYDSTDEEDEDLKTESAVSSSVSTHKQVLYNQGKSCYAPK
jgi:hypothetical protein